MNRVWFGGLQDNESIALSAFDRGISLGDGVFETLLVVNERPLWLEQHIARLKTSATELRIGFPVADINTSIAELCRGLKGLHVLRLTLTRGVAGRGLASEGDGSTYFATAQPFKHNLMFEPVALGLAATRRNEMSASSRMKTLSYMDQILAAREVAAQGFDDAIMLNARGKIASTTMGNVFLVFGKTLVTPSLDQGVLPGIMRRVVLDRALQAGFSVEERPVEAAETEKADGVFVTNSLRFIRSSRHHSLQDYGTLVDIVCADAKAQCGIDPRQI